MASFLPPPDMTSLAPFISHIPEMLRSEVEAELQGGRQANAGPFSEDANQLRVDSSKCDALTENISALDAAEKKIDALKDYVKLAKTFATRRLAMYRSLASPMRKLPNEVLQLIFMEVHAQSTEKERRNPITAQVCTFWRQVAEAIPTLWTEVNVNLEAEDAVDRVAQMDARMTRAKQQLVAVEFLMPKRLALSRLDPFDPPRTKVAEGDYHFIAAVTTVLKHRDHVGSLQIPAYDPTLGDYFAMRCAAEDVTFKNLHTLSLYEDQELLYVDFDAGPLLKACPNINQLRIFEVPDTSHVRWEKIKAFKGLIHAEALSALVSRGQNIEQAEIKSSFWSFVPNITFSQRLTALSLHQVTPQCAARLATVARPPSLRYLSLSVRTADFATSGLMPLLRSWGSGLEFLALLFAITAKALKEVLQCTPKIQCLRLPGDRATPANFFTLVPNLTHLEICGCFEDYIEPRVRKLLAKLLAPSSQGKMLPLRSVAFLPGLSPEMWIGGDVRPEDIQPWTELAQDLQAVGIRVHEYRSPEKSNVSCGELGFDTAFFQEREWCV